LVGAPGATVRLDPLPEPAWAQWRDVLVHTADGTPVPVAVVVLGPTGIHVVTRQESSARASFTLRSREAQRAAAAVSSALPGRYRPAVAAALMIETVDVETTTGTPETHGTPDTRAPHLPGAEPDPQRSAGPDADGVLVDGVLVATTRALVEALRFKPRVLSRSEARVIFSVLSAALVPQVPDQGRRPGLWGRFRRQAACFTSLCHRVTLPAGRFPRRSRRDGCPQGGQSRAGKMPSSAMQ
jgi:hypothetical protein